MCNDRRSAALDTISAAISALFSRFKNIFHYKFDCHEQTPDNILSTQKAAKPKTKKKFLKVQDSIRKTISLENRFLRPITPKNKTRARNICKRKSQKLIKQQRYMPYVLYPWTSVLWSFFLATTVTVYDANSDRWYHRYYKWHYEKMYNCVHLVVTAVRRHHDGFVFLWVKTRKNCTLVGWKKLKD